MIRRKKSSKTTAKSRSNKSCPFCGVPFVHVGKPTRACYDWYIQYSKIWTAIRKWALLRAGDKCERCGVGFPLQVHHHHYAHLGYEFPEDVVVLCENCHSKKHPDK
jgi:5-methylcytosine-specific restriction endonuclease McrA